MPSPESEPSALESDAPSPYVPPFDTRNLVGRHGFEVQTTFLVHPRHLNFDPTGKKLGVNFVPETLPDLMPLPDPFYWIGDPVQSRAYFKKKRKHPRKKWRPFFISNHHDDYADSVGYKSLWIYAEEPYVCFQLELVSRPLDDDYTDEDFDRDIRFIWHDALPELVETDVVRSYARKAEHRIREQVSLEIDDVRWPRRVDPMKKLARLASGMWLLTRWADRITFANDYDRVSLAFQAADLDENARKPVRYDLFTNARLLWEGCLFGRLPLAQLRRFLTSRAHVAALGTCFDNDRCFFLIHGLVDLAAEDYARLSLDDFATWRALGIDSMVPQILAGIPTEHIHPRRARRWEYLRGSLPYHYDHEPNEAHLRAALLGGDAPTEGASFPLLHPRKTISDGCIYIECRHAMFLSRVDHPRYARTHEVVGPKLKVASLASLRPVARDWSRQFDIALTIGEELLHMLKRGDPILRRGDEDALRAKFLPWIDRLYHTYRRPHWGRRTDLASNGRA